ncbi:TylF/MycF/NovP-related O-methyltransferase [Mycobacterium intracellulare]|uniref:TylF/MycF/NovP-related O-methyltransferase n=1 Tax=Mycobacterium intracellulare TaxID=1767 RepID=A0AAE4RHI0_MYCIT|nr:TylF/MycF/NovP-related O-methyltransferase [Mycobacterium intracellulare]MDV6979678.1 TylF/MycF/NovP-related O-methyltransferase [Mycobacterium intracellulare]MDV6985181.1 TylF/MycF/NovP-related O-methyltransferase [Mycobacterium intracellulare]MDV7014199.1 TylF/MycF/NovP-related O-methyltransferase [Mycobacterium intracellulare]MDV7030172.1 TylF/MycF/NovP-related O-methyltransferase [Mycobacterium intracellulare]
MLTDLRDRLAHRVNSAIAARGALPTKPGQVSLLQRGETICKVPYNEKKLRKQFHEMKDEAFWEIVRDVHDFTQLPMEPMWSLYQAVRYLVSKRIPGDMVECGVFFGGASMLIAKTLLSLGDTSRRLWLYDSFEGFVGEQAHDDVTWYGDSIDIRIDNFESIVRGNIASTGYPMELVSIVPGDIEKIAPGNQNGDIALLRLDTDTYHSTAAELEHFFPKLVQGGVLIIDDYGHAFGARRAVDEYLSDPSRKVLLHRVNFANRIGVKV